MRAIIAVAVALLASSGAQAGVLVVDFASGPYKSLQAAVDAAADGDVVLVKPTTHLAGGATVINGKSVVVTFDDALLRRDVRAGRPGVPGHDDPASPERNAL